MRDFDADLNLLLTSPISRETPGTKQERKELLESILHVARDIFGDRSEANKVLLATAIVPEFPSNIRALMDYQIQRHRLAAIIVVGIS